MSKNEENDSSEEIGDEDLNTSEVENSEEEYSEENIPDDDANKPERKKVAALRARHKLEDYFEQKKLKDALDYLDEDGIEKSDKKKK